MPESDLQARKVEFPGPQWLRRFIAGGFRQLKCMANMCINLVREYPRLADYVGVETEVLILVENFVFLEVGEHFPHKFLTSGLALETNRRLGLANFGVPWPKSSFRRMSMNSAR
jgi:hypothetical protein